MASGLDAANFVSKLVPSTFNLSKKFCNGKPDTNQSPLRQRLVNSLMDGILTD
jgi:hypothetical protein